MRQAIGLVMVAACGGSSSASQTPAAVAGVPATPALVTASAEGATALLRPGAALRWRRHGELVGVSAKRAEAVVVAPDGSDVNLRFVDDDIELALWADVGMLSPVIVRATTVRVGDVRGSELLAGAPIAIVERRAGAVRVRHHERDLLIEGEVDASAVGLRYDRAPRPALDGGSTALCGRVDVRSAPDGVVIAVATAEAPMCTLAEVRTAGGAANGWQPVQVQTDDAEVRGVVRVDDIATGTILGGISTDRAGPANGLALERGACLYDGPGGAVVGATRHPRRWAARATDGGWHWLTVEVAGLAVQVAARPSAAPCRLSDR